MDLSLTKPGLYEESSPAWPGIDWPRAAFECHLETVAEGWCSHPIDFYLSGAAGFWVEGAWDAVTKETRSVSLAYLSRYRDFDETEREDCYTTVIGRLLRLDDRFDATEFQLMGFMKPPCAIVHFNGSSKLSTYVISGVENEARSTLRRRKQNSKPYSLGDQSDTLSSEADQPHPDLRRELHLIEAGLRDAIRDFDPEDRLLFLLVIERGMKRNAAADFLGWQDPTRATRRLQKLSEVIGSVIDRVVDKDSKVENRLTVQVWGKILSRVLQDYHSSSSDYRDEQNSDSSEPPV